MRNVIIGLVILLAVLHQDFWYWSDPTLVFGFLPIGLAYHVLFSLLSGAVWALAVFLAWPDEWVEELESTQSRGTRPQRMGRSPESL